MTRYAVRVSSTAAEKIAEYGFYIAKQSGSVEIAERWMTHVYATVDKLRYSPRRFVFAEEKCPPRLRDTPPDNRQVSCPLHHRR